MLSGSCLCGGVTFTLAPPVRHAIACHCVQCRKTSGHYWSATNVPNDQLTLITSDTLTWYDSSDFARRGFCAVCGSSLFYQRHATGSTAIGAGTLNGPTGLAEPEHIFTDDKGDYYALPDGVAVAPRWSDTAPCVPDEAR